MPYAVQRKDRSAARAARRIADEQAGRALALIDREGALSAEEIHRLRTTVKRLRALVRLIGPGLADAETLDRMLRNAGRAISAPRDSEVMLATLDALAPTGLPALRAAFEAAHAAAHADYALDEGLAAYRAKIAEVAERAKGWKLKSKGFGAFAPGLETTFAKTRKDWRTARATGNVEALHDTRKRIKAHGYQARLMEPIWPEMMAAHRAVVDDLGETLGQMNDLTLFAARAATLDLPPAERDTARALAAARHAELMAAVLPRTDKLLSERPEALAERWRGWWKAWQKDG